MRGVEVEVEQRSPVHDVVWSGSRVGEVVGVSGASCCCDVWVAARQLDAGLELRCGCSSEQCRGRHERAVVGVDVCDGGGRELQ